MIKEIGIVEAWKYLPRSVRRSYGKELLEDDRYIARIDINDNGTINTVEIGYKEDAWALQ